jgi:N-dimethylarginine dimethylaminohydrolase
MIGATGGKAMAAWGVDSETGTLRDVLLCRPEHYEWLPLNAVARASLAGPDRPAPDAVMAEYRELEAALDQAGVRRHELRVEPHLRYQVYTRDSCQMTPWGALLTQMALPARRGEYAAVLDFLREAAIPLWRCASHGTIEGGDIAVIRPGLVAIGCTGGRTDRDGATQLAAWFAAEGWEARIVPLPEHFLHLDVVFCMAAEGLAVACPDAFDDDFLQWLAERQIRVVPAGYRDAMDLACNLLALGEGRVVSARHATRLNAALRAEGITVLDPELRLITRGGGGAHCMTMPLRRDPLSRS